jgi:serine/threonine protein kinase
MAAALSITAGAFAIVERCVYRPKGGRPRMVAVKRLKPDLTQNPDDLRDLIQEVTLLRKLSHK